MLSLDEHEIDILMVALTDFRLRCAAYAGEKDGYNDITALAGAPKHCCSYVLREVRKLIARIEQFQKDQAKEKADG